VAELERFLTEARLDAIGVFEYSDEDGTEAVDLDGKVTPAAIAGGTPGSARWPRNCATSGRRTGSARPSRFWSSRWNRDGVEGRAAHQAPEVDGSTTLEGGDLTVRVGDLVRATVVASNGWTWWRCRWKLSTRPSPPATWPRRPGHERTDVSDALVNPPADGRRHVCSTSPTRSPYCASCWCGLRGTDGRVRMVGSGYRIAAALAFG